MTTALEGGKWSAAHPGHTLLAGKTRYPFYRRLGGPQGRSGRAENFVPTGIRSWIVQPVVSRSTDWATRPTIIYQYQVKNAHGLALKQLISDSLSYTEQFHTAGEKNHGKTCDNTAPHALSCLVFRKTTIVNNKLILLIQIPSVLDLPNLLTDHELGNKPVPGAQWCGAETPSCS